ncbi:MULTISPECIES: amidohydrolase [Bacillota]|uniref:Amidohydrolase n=2 Tax=Bacillota TaxID=1239 RepID=A0A9X3XXW8_ENTFC|nr:MULTISPECIES: amidohydrolase [Bacillota]MDC4242380.1 amidohydrolase [Clostridium tertium]MDC4246149.1 amidohydrolase [Clostridium perfringens]MDC4248963.1 amidohydrolase [Enterococcus faecium]
MTRDIDGIDIHLDEDVCNEEANTIRYRRYFRQHPESSLAEYETAAFIQKELELAGIEYISVGETGTLATIRGSKKGPVIFLRGDIDALEMRDDIDKGYASVNSGLCHACGHDTHAASLLSAARILNKRKDRLSGTIKLAFQQAEEIGAGARIFVKEGHLDDVDFAFGIHIASNIQIGKIGLAKGEQYASCDIFKINVIGEGAHACSPHLAHDALIATANIVQAIQNIITREIDQMENTLISLGKISSGTRYNIVASKGELEGTYRAFNQETRSKIRRRIEEVAELTARLHGCRIVFENYEAADPLVNEGKKTAIAQKIAGDIVGRENVIDDDPASLGAEDFADYLAVAPGCFARVGARSQDESTHYPHHHVLFDIDERALAISTQLYVDIAQKAVDHIK